MEFAIQPPPMDTVDTIIIIGFLVLITAVGYFMSSMASEGVDDYFLGKNKIPWWVLGISTATSNFDMSGTMIIVAMVYELGYRGFLVEIRGGVGLSLAFLMVFLGKWLRRSRVMTSAQFMKFRFGTDTAGKAAHLLSAITQSIMCLGMIIYFCVGSGKFLQFFLPWDANVCTGIMVAVGLAYTLMSGLYGVVFTDVIQMIILSFAAVYIAVKGFNVDFSSQVTQGWYELSLSVPDSMQSTLMAIDPAFELFGICVIFYFFRTTLEGMGGIGGYTDQRFFAARNEREAGLLTLESIMISVLRWAMVAGLVALGYQMVASGAADMAAEIQAIQSDAENVLPAVISGYIPAGMKGFMIAGLIAAAMSTFDSTLNAGASYLTIDIYKPYINPKATAKQLVRASQISTISLAVVGALIGFTITDINSIWQYITIAIGPAMLVPYVLRWYWPRYNGWGFAWGTGSAMITALAINGFGGSMPMYQSVPIVISVALVVSVIVSLMTPPVNDDTLCDFYMKVNPGGFWRKYANMVLEKGMVSKAEHNERYLEKAYDIISTCLAVPFQFCILIATMAFIFHDWEKFAYMGLITCITGLGLYFFWFKNLKPEDICAQEDEHYGSFQDETSDGSEQFAHH